MKRISYILIPILAILLMSHNTSALSFSATDTRNYDKNRSGAFLMNNENTHYFLNGSTAPDLVYLIDGALNVGIPTNTSRINGFQLGFAGYAPNKYILNLSYRLCPSNPDQLKSWIGFSTDAYNSILEQQWIINGSCINGSVSVFGATSNRNNIQLGSNGGGLNAGNFTAGGSIIFNKPNFIILSDDADYNSVLNAIKNNTDDIKTKLDQIKESANDALDREQSETQDAADAAETAGNSSSSDATTATSSLISVIGGFVSVVTSATPTNCKINTYTSHLDMGQIDLCDNPVPAYIQIIGSIILICAVIPLAIILFNRFIGLFRSFQG